MSAMVLGVPVSRHSAFLPAAVVRAPLPSLLNERQLNSVGSPKADWPLSSQSRSFRVAERSRLSS